MAGMLLVLTEEGNELDVMWQLTVDEQSVAGYVSKSLAMGHCEGKSFAYSYRLG